MNQAALVGFEPTTGGIFALRLDRYGRVPQPVWNGFALTTELQGRWPPWYR